MCTPKPLPRVPAVLAAAVLALAALTAVAFASTITVTSVSDALANDGVCTLREAIASANANTAPFAGPGECAAGTANQLAQDVIAFAIPGEGVHTIAPASPLPAIVSPALIDGYTQPGASANTLAVGNDAVLRIEIDASLVDGTGLFRLQSSSTGSTLRGLVLNRAIASGAYVRINTGNNVLAGNFIGTDPTGTSLPSNGPHRSIDITGGNGNRIGGTAPADRNLFAGGGTAGNAQVHIAEFGNSGTLIQGNYFGTSASGASALLPSALNGAIRLGSGSNVVGGAAAGAGNVIVASDVAIRISSFGNNNSIEGNFIGTDATGTIGLANGTGTGIGDGFTATSGNRIGGVGSGNVISSFATGLRIGGGVFVVQGNRIGTDATGTLPIPNGEGIVLGNNITGSSGGQFGGTGAGEGNVVAFNNGRGILVFFGSGWAIRGNSMFGNGGLGISFDPLGQPTPNDAGDGDSGPNDRQNYPVISSVVEGAGNVTVVGTLASTASTTFRLEIFASDACDASGFGEGQTMAGAVDVTTDGAGNASFGPLVLAVPAGRLAITATATNPGGSTSELSACVDPRVVFVDGFESGNPSRWSGAVG